MYSNAFGSSMLFYVIKCFRLFYVLLCNQMFWHTDNTHGQFLGSLPRQVFIYLFAYIFIIYYYYYCYYNDYYLILYHFNLIFFHVY